MEFIYRRKFTGNTYTFIYINRIKTNIGVLNLKQKNVIHYKIILKYKIIHTII